MRFGGPLGGRCCHSGISGDRRLLFANVRALNALFFSREVARVAKRHRKSVFDPPPEGEVVSGAG
jgi:hypothetical protein